MKNQVKFLLILVLVFLAGEVVSAQDILTLKSGDVLKVTIIEEGTDFISYREFNNQAGPLYTIKKDKVAAINYKDGPKNISKPVEVEAKPETVKDKSVTVSEDASGQLLVCKKRYIYQGDKKLASRSIKTLMEDNPEALELFEKGFRQCNISNGCALAIVATCSVASIIGSNKDDEGSVRASAIGLGISGGFIIAGIITASTGKHKLRRSVELYNKGINKPVSYKIDIGLHENGVGLALLF